MEFSALDLQPNQSVALDQVIVGNASDVRWRALPADVERIDRLDAHRLALAARVVVHNSDKR